MTPSYQRTHAPEQGVVLVVQPYGCKSPAPGAEPFDFDWLYTHVVAPTIEKAGFKPERIDGLYGPSGVMDLFWRALCRAELVVADLTGRSANVNLELGMALTLGKKIIVLTQSREDIPTDIGGLYRYVPYSEKAVDIDKLREELPLNLTALRQEPSQEMTLTPMFGITTRAPGRVEAVQSDYVTVRSGDRIGHLRGADVDYSRLIPDMRRRFKVGDEVSGSFVFDVANQETRYTLLAGLDNPWPQLAARFPVGSNLTGTVVNSVDTIGVFVRVLGNISGLVPRGTIAGTWPNVGEEVDVVVASLNPSERRVTLQMRIGTGRPQAQSAPTASSLPASGEKFDGEVVRIVPEQDGRGGYVLLRLDGHQRPAMLLVRDMLEDLADDFKHDRLELGDIITVEVSMSDPRTRKVLLKDLGDLVEDKLDDILESVTTKSEVESVA